jgi:hypothetical protein
MRRRDWDHLQAELGNAKKRLTAKDDELKRTRTELTAMERKLARTEVELASMRAKGRSDGDSDAILGDTERLSDLMLSVLDKLDCSSLVGIPGDREMRRRLIIQALNGLDKSKFKEMLRDPARLQGAIETAIHQPDLGHFLSAVGEAYGETVGEELLPAIVLIGLALVVAIAYTHPEIWILAACKEMQATIAFGLNSVDDLAKIPAIAGLVALLTLTASVIDIRDRRKLPSVREEKPAVDDLTRMGKILIGENHSYYSESKQEPESRRERDIDEGKGFGH